MKRAASCARENLISFGVCFGKFTKTKKFRLQITALDYLAPYAQYKLWVSSLRVILEWRVFYRWNRRANKVFFMEIMFWNRVWEESQKEQNSIKVLLFTVWATCHLVSFFVIVISNLYIFEGFGVAAKSTMDCRKADPMNIVGFHQADVGEYIRSEDTLI